MKNQELPLISIALCTYNGAKFIKAQLDTLVGQSYPNLEIVAVDDRSDDETWEILQDYSRQFPHFHCYRNEKTLGFQKNFAKAMRICKGEWIAIADQDDIWDLDKISMLYQITPGNVLVYHDSELIDESGESMDIVLSQRLNFVKGKNPKAFLFFNCVSGHSMLFHNQILSHALPFPEKGFYDHWIAFVASHFGKIDYINQPLVKYRQHDQNCSDILGKKSRLRGLARSIDRIKTENEWLGICSRFQDPQNKFGYAKYLYTKAQKRITNYFNLELGWEIWINRNSLLSIQRNSEWYKLCFAIRNVWGIKTKTIFKTYIFKT